jgi:hypothetical protein
MNNLKLLLCTGAYNPNYKPDPEPKEILPTPEEEKKP